MTVSLLFFVFEIASTLYSTFFTIIQLIFIESTTSAFNIETSACLFLNEEFDNI